MKINGISVHTKVTPQAVLDAVERSNLSLDNPGFCILCGCEAEGVEPDAQNYECEACGSEQVFGAEELLIYLT